jgi:hypothetical protein
MLKQARATNIDIDRDRDLFSGFYPTAGNILAL